jgi:hypothetical protein
MVLNLKAMTNDGITLLFYNTELRLLSALLYTRLVKTDKLKLKIKLKPPIAYVLYNIINELPDEYFAQPMLMRQILGVIDQKAVSFKPVNKMAF